MKLNILIGGKAGQGINAVSGIIAKVLADYGYFTFNYRDYQSLIRGGHNFNVLSLSDEWIASHESEIDFIIALDENTISLHKNKLKKSGKIIPYSLFPDAGKNLNIALASALVKIFGLPKELILKHTEKFQDSGKAVENGYESQKQELNLKKLNNKISIISGTQGIASGAINSGMNIYYAYPMTPATPLMHELASKKISDFFIVQPENEIAGINQALGSSFAGKITMIGTSGGGFDLMTEALSFSGQSEIPIVVYLASRPGPSTGIPTYTSQDDLDIALRAGHGEFPRIVLAPGDANECIEKTNEAFYLAEKYKCPVILLSDKHLAESDFSHDKKANPILKIKMNRKIPGKEIIKASSYEHLAGGETTESETEAIKNAKARLKKYSEIKKEIEKLEPIKIYGKQSKNLIIAWGSTKGAILDSIKNLDCRFMQVLYLKPLSDKIKKEMLTAENIILIENNATGQLGRLLREKTGISIEEKNRILKYDGRPFTSDLLREKIKGRLV